MIRAQIAFILLVATHLTAGANTPAPAWLGIGFTWQSGSEEQRFLHVRKVTDGGPAYRAGVRPGDIITTIDEQSVDIGDELDLLLFLAEKRAGDRLRLGVTRAGTSRVIVVVLGSLPEAARAAWERNLRMAQERRRQRTNRE